MGHDGSRLPPSWGLWLALLLWGLLLLYLLAPILPVHGQTQSERLASIERELTNSLVTCAKLSAVLTVQSGKLDSLSSDLAALRQSLADSERKLDDLENELKGSQELSQDLRREVLRLGDLLRTLQERLDALSKTFDSYREAKDREVKALERQVTGWKVVAGIFAVLAAALGTWAAVK